VTWDDGALGNIIAGQRVRGSDGALLGGNFAACSVNGGGRSAVAWSSTSNTYLVACSNFDEVYCQRLSNTGASLGGVFNISNEAFFSGYPAVSYGLSGNQFLVTWDYNDGNIRAQRIDAGTGAFLGPKFDVTPGGANDRSCSAYDHANGRWLVQFNRNNAGFSYDQYGQLVTTSGSLVGSLIPIAATTGFEGDTFFGGDVAFTPGTARYLSSFGTDFGTGGQESHASGAPVATQIQLASSGGSLNNAADTNLNRFLTVWENLTGGLHYATGQLFEATANPAPGPVINLVVSSGTSQNTLTWANPVETFFTGTLIRYRTDSYPTSPVDGTLVVDKVGTAGANDSYIHGGLTNGTTYYYSVWSHNITPIYGVVKNGNATPTAQQCFSDGFTYANSNLNGNGGWSGSAGAEIQIVSQTVKVNGGATAFDSIKTVTCGDPGAGFIRVVVKIQKGVGTTTMWSLWCDDAAGANLARWYGTGTTAKGRIGNTTSVTADQILTGGWDELMVKINPYNNTTEFFFNSVSIGVLDHSQTGATDTLGRLRFERLNNSGAVGNFLSFDDLSVGEPSGPPPLPGQASSPSPPNGATGTSITPTLNWIPGSNATSRDVYFGTSNPPAFVQNQTATSYIPGTLGAGLTYFWRIDEKNSSGTTTGMVWSFTTLPLPGQANTPSPTNGATNVAITADLSWSAGSNAASHDILFGTSNPPPFVVNQSVLTYDTGTLANSTTYYWRIDEVNGSGKTTGPIWSFTTAAASNPPAVPTITGPANGSIVASLTPTITWNGDAHTGYQVRISQQNNSGTATNGWDSGDVTSTGNSAVSGTLRNYSLYYAFVRLRNSAGWGGWSANGYSFIVNTDSNAGTVYITNSLPTANGWTIFDTSSFENGGNITSTITADGGSNVWKLFDNSTANRCKERYGVSNVSFDTGATVAARMRCSSTSGTPAFNLGISNGNVGGMFLRVYTTEIRLVDTAGTSRGTYSLTATSYHKYQLTVKNSTLGNNSTAVWRVYVDGMQQISWTGAGTQDGYDGFFAGHGGTNGKGTWWFDWIAARSDGEFSPAQWDALN
jgi:hypothetical protein